MTLIQEVNVVARCVSIERLSGKNLRLLGYQQTATVLNITVEHEHVLWPVNLSKPMNPHLGMINPTRREALRLTMPETIRVTEQRHSHKDRYRLNDHDVKDWALQARELLHTDPSLRRKR